MQVTQVSEEEQILTVTIAQKTILKDLCQSKGTISNEQNLNYESNKQAYR